VPFREPRIRKVEGSVTYGPFPTPVGGIFTTFAILVAAIGLCAMGIDEDRLVCTPDATCVITRRLGPDTPPFPTSALRDVSVEIESGSKNRKYGVLYLVLDDDSAIRFTRTDPTKAIAVSDRLRPAIAEKRAVDERVRGPWWALVAAFFVFLGSLASLRSTLRKVGRFRLDVVRDGSALRVQRSVLGIPFTPYNVSLEGVVDVRVERKWLGDTSNPRTPATPAARIVLVDRSGNARPLTDRPFPGFATHLRAAAALRAILGLTPQPGGVEDQLAKLPPVTTPLGTRFGFAWLGFTVGGLLGLALYGIVGLSLGLLRAQDGISPLALVVGFGGGAVSGVLLAAYLTRPRPPR